MSRPDVPMPQSAAHRALAVYEIIDTIVTLASWDRINRNMDSGPGYRVWNTWCQRNYRAVSRYWKTIIDEKAMSSITVTNGEMICKNTSIDVQDMILDNPAIYGRMVKHVWLSPNWCPRIHRVPRLRKLGSITHLYGVTHHTIEALAGATDWETVDLPNLSYLDLVLDEYCQTQGCTPPIMPYLRSLSSLDSMRLVISHSKRGFGHAEYNAVAILASCGAGLVSLELNLAADGEIAFLEDVFAIFVHLKQLKRLVYHAPSSKHVLGFMDILPATLQEFSLTCCSTSMQEVLAKLGDPTFMPGLARPPVLSRLTSCPSGSLGEFRCHDCPRRRDGARLDIPAGFVRAFIEGWIKRAGATAISAAVEAGYYGLVHDTADDFEEEWRNAMVGNAINLLGPAHANAAVTNAA